MRGSYESMALRRNTRSLVSVFVIVSVFIVGLITVISMIPQEEERLAVRQSIPSKLPKKIGIIRHLKVLDPVIDGFQVEMENLGFVNGKNVVYDIQLASDSLKLVQIVQDACHQFRCLVDLASRHRDSKVVYI